MYEEELNWAHHNAFNLSFLCNELSLNCEFIENGFKVNGLEINTDESLEFFVSALKIIVNKDTFIKED
jgi:hypothetical protein